MFADDATKVSPRNEKLKKGLYSLKYFLALMRPFILCSYHPNQYSV